MSTEPDWGARGLFALMRNATGGDWSSAVLLMRVQGLWRTRKKKLSRLGMEWIAMSREDWARSAGLTDIEMRDRALPNLRKQPFVVIRTMRLPGSQKKNGIWISLDEGALAESLAPWDMHDPVMTGQKVIGIVGNPTNVYPFKKAVSE